MKKCIRERVVEHGFPGSVQAEETEHVSCLEAYTDLQSRRMTIRYNPAFDPDTKQASRYCEAKKMGRPLEACVADVAGHECGHIRLKDGKSCPGDVENHEKYFFSPIFSVLRRHKKEGVTDGLVNLVEDLIDNTIARRHQDHGGLVLLYDDVGRTKGWDLVFEAYMRVQMFCWGDIKDKELLREHYTSDENVIKATRNIISRLNLKRGESYDMLADKDNWENVSIVMSEELAPLIDVPSMVPVCGFGRAMEEAMNDPTNRQKFAVRRYEEGREDKDGSQAKKGRGRRAGRAGSPAYMDVREALDHVYTHMAKQIPLKVDEISRQESFPIVPFQHVAYDPEEHRLEDINWRRPAIVPESPFGGHVSFQAPQHYYELPLKVKMGLKGFPSLKFGLVDCSSSMTEGIRGDAGSTAFIPWGDESKYHYACRTWYGLVEFLARQGILPNVEVSAGVFSNRTRVGKGIDEAKRMMLSPEFGGTELDIDVVERMFSGRKSVFFTISDGEIANWGSIRDAFIVRAKEHHYFHIQIGRASDATRSLKRAGLPVYQVSRGEDMERLAINLTRRAYDQYVSDVTTQLQGGMR